MTNEILVRRTVAIPGTRGPAGQIVEATAVPLDDGEQPTVTLGGTPEKRTMEFGLPRGPKGPKGDPGEGSVNSVNNDFGPDITLGPLQVGGSTSATSGTMPIRSTSGRLPGIGAPVNAGDAATKQYVDDGVGALGSSITEKFITTDVQFPADLNLRNAAGLPGIKCKIPTPQTPSGGETVHPSVLYFPDGWNGYKYWMGFTPYPAGNDAHEDPCIVASHDGDTWVVPPGHTNPLDDAPGTPRFNSDTELVYADGKMWLFWRYLDQNAGATSLTIYVRTSTDGKTWTAKQIVFQSNAMTNANYLSPTLTFDGTRWTMWMVNWTASPSTLVRFTSTGKSPLLGQWSSGTNCTLAVPTGRSIWHIQIRQIGSALYGILNDCESGASGNNGDLYLIRSINGGTTWERSPKPIIQRLQTGEHTSLYRATLLPGFQDGQFGFHVWYSAWRVSGSQVWNTYRTFVGQDTGWITISPSTGWEIVAGHVPAVRVRMGTLFIRGMLKRLTGGSLTELARIPVTIPIHGEVAVLAGAHMALKSGASDTAFAEIGINTVTGIISVGQYTTMDSSINWMVPITATIAADQEV